MHKKRCPMLRKNTNEAIVDGKGMGREVKKYQPGYFFG